MKGDQQARFFGKFGKLMQAGIPLLRAFEVAAERVEDGELREALGRALARAFEGSSLLDALGAEEGLFAREVLCLVGEGERIGDIERKAVAIAEGLASGDFATGVATGGAVGGDAGLSGLLGAAAAAGAGFLHVGPTEVAMRVGRTLARVETAVGVHELLRALGRRGDRFREGTLRVRAIFETLSEGPAAVLRLLPGGGRTLADAGLGEEEIREVEGWLRREAGIVLAYGPTGHGVEALLEGMVALIDRDRRRVVTTSVADLPGVLVAAPGADVCALDADVAILGPGATSQDLKRALRVALDGGMVLSGLDAPDADAAFRQARAIEPEAADAVLLGAVGMRAGPGSPARVTRFTGRGT
jgi:hypothetical protein